MDCVHQLGGENQRFGALVRIQPLISPAESEHFFYTVCMMHFEKQRSDYIVESGAQSSASDNPGASFRRIKEKISARTRQFKEEVPRRWRTCGTNDGVGNTLRIANPTLYR